MCVTSKRKNSSNTSIFVKKITFTILFYQPNKNTQYISQYYLTQLQTILIKIKYIFPSRKKIVTEKMWLYLRCLKHPVQTHSLKKPHKLLRVKEDTFHYQHRKIKFFKLVLMWIQFETFSIMVHSLLNLLLTKFCQPKL